MIRKTWKRWLILMLALFLATAGVASLLANEKEETDWKAYDLIGMLDTISRHNAELDQTNKTIVGRMEALDRQTGKTGEVADRLQEVSSGLAGQNGTLHDLIPVTADQVTLSTNLRNLSMKIKGSMKQIEDVSLRQKNELARMQQTVSGTRQQLGQVAKENEELNRLLQEAEAKSRKIEQSIP
ncbi:hypothetical protein G3578_03770 [Brevibacillus sp. SYP-B805]|uniref:hypothetical protein n=1 Tax=Brevibacillus sp. SYP-B805 TaxID=1578199 RepID=UPI0013EAFE71|nr:hypothetical protein [Brevibacillus sp. SYP-B805]NGQ94292.1 hypothetical protein [Brevibacillus sp. SYP-B805]